MKVDRYKISGVFMITPPQITDERGFFSEIFRADIFCKEIENVSFVQDNHSFSSRKGTLRGLHCQLPPFQQGKLVRVVRGSVIDVAVDIRSNSPTFGEHVAVVLSADNWRQLWIPAGFLHGFCTLEDDTEVLYKVTNYYSADHDRSVAWNDPDIGITWPSQSEQLVISPKDLAAGSLRALVSEFQFPLDGGAG